MSLAPAPNICAAVFTSPFVPVSITNAPTIAPFTKCVAPAQSPWSSSAETLAHVVFTLPTMTMATSSVEPPARLPAMLAPPSGRFAFTSSALVRRTTCSFLLMPRKPYLPSTLHSLRSLMPLQL